MMINRDKEITKNRILAAVGEIVGTEGFKALGVNAVARRAGVDKVLIYRYFGSFEGLLKEYIGRKDYYLNIEPLYKKISDAEYGQIAGLAEEMFLGQIQAVLGDKELRELLLWELMTDDEITAETAAKREQMAVKLLSSIKKKSDFADADIPALSAILLGGIYYLALRARNVKMYNGINLSTSKGWKRIENAVKMMIKTVLR